MSKIKELEEIISQLTEIVKDETETMSDKELLRLFYQYMYVLSVYTNKDCTENSRMNCIKWLELAHKLEEDV